MRRLTAAAVFAGLPLMEHPMERKLVSTPKLFFIKERDQTYSNWTVSFFREFFQNSTDANAKNISITLQDADGRGAFDEVGDHTRKVTRVVIDDDGVGMTEEILDKVYFAIGQTTKDDGSSVGGYGRARLMTCFSQARYSILTLDRFVMGDGPNYVNYNLDEAAEALSKAIAGMEANSGNADSESLSASIAALRSDLEMVREAAANGGHKGCRIEVDIDQQQKVRWRVPDAGLMAEALKSYLSESQIAANVTVNGQTPEDYFDYHDGKLQARRGPAKRVLTAVVDGEKVSFATVHTSEGAKARHKGQMIVRVDGASMYTTPIQADGVQVILEIDKALSRSVLNSNRDGLKHEYRDSVEAFIAELNVDNTSALADKVSKDNFTIRGDRGMLMAAAPNIRALALDQVIDDEITEAAYVASRPVQKMESLEALKARGLTQDVVEELVRAANYGEGFICELRWDRQFALSEDLDTFVSEVREKYYDKKAVELFLESASDRLKEWLASTIGRRTEKALEEASKAIEERLKDMNDVHVSIISTNEKTKAAIRRNDPRKWDVETGKGRIPRALLASWTAACAVAVETLMKLRPAFKQFEWTTGWVYSVPEEMDQGDRYRQVSVEAMCQSENGVFRFLLNPVNEDGTLRYSVTSQKDRQRMQALAMHEVAHVLESYHNEVYAGILTDFMKEYDNAAANRRMKDAVRAVMAAYESGKARVQSLDDKPGPRPAERLMAYATANEPAAPDAFERHDDGTWTVDTDRMQEPAPADHEDYGLRM